MAEEKYHFDPHSLSYDKVEAKKGKRILMLVTTQVLAAVVIAVLLFVAFSYLYETPEQRRLKRENKKLNEQFEQLDQKFNQTELVLQELKDRDDNIYRAIFETDPLHSNDWNKMYGDQDPYAQFEGSDFIDLTEQTSKKMDNMQNLLYIQAIEYDNLLKLMDRKSDLLKSIPSIQPLPNSNLQFVPYGFGRRIDPLYKTPNNHNGMDFAAPRGTQVIATADGIVKRADEKVRGFGKHIRINHGNNYETIYAHLNDILVHQGQKVKKGDIIGFVGNTGKSLVAHLHYEVHLNGKAVNPVNYFFEELSPNKYNRLIQLTSRGGLSLD